MGTLNETPVWEAGVRHFEANAVLTGGPDCPDNLPLFDLANRTAWLKQQVESAQGGLAGHASAVDPHPQYLTSAEGDAKVAAHEAAADPHPAYWNNVRGDAKIAAAIAALVNSSPATLDTLAELATALGNDPSFATTITNSLSTKATQSGVQGQTYTAFTTTGASGAFVLTPNPAVTAYAAGQRFRVKFHAAGNGADAININALGNKSLKQYDSAGMKVAAVIAANQLADMEYDGADMVILDPLPVAAGYDTFPFASLPFPTIANATNRLSVTGNTVAGQGGSVTVPAGVYMSLCEAVTANTGRKRSFVTGAWTSGTLDISSTYFLRAKVIAGVLTFYTQKGTDTDATPAGLVGTVDGANGGGFDSNCIDMLVAKVVTGTAGTTPTVTALANAEYLYARSSESTVVCVAGTNVAGVLSGATGAESWVNLRFETLNWGRKPKFGLAQIGQMNMTTEMNVLMLPQTYTRYRILGTYSGSPSFVNGDGIYVYMEAFA